MSGFYIFYEADLSGTSVLNELPTGDEFSTATFRIERKCSVKERYIDARYGVFSGIFMPS